MKLKVGDWNYRRILSVLRSYPLGKFSQIRWAKQ